MPAIAARKALQPPAVRSAVLLIDFQRAFLDGPWARHFGIDQVAPISKAVDRADALFQARAFAHMPLVTSRCYLEEEGRSPPVQLEPHLLGKKWFWKPSPNIMKADGFPSWMLEQLQSGVDTLVIGGCTTTSCVRVSSQAVQKAYCDRGLQVVVDLSLCGARVNNYDPAHAARDQLLREVYGTRSEGRSAVELAIVQMRESGVTVVDDWFSEACNHSKKRYQPP